ncbi:MAG TPA: RidA family protein [Acetobacteraceae bacterium]|nr:RidA family protein [Acetobacteraceae bacterium]
MARRQSINFPGFSHQNPIPNASRIGNFVMSSVIGPSNPGTRDIPPTLEEQVKNLFVHLRAAIEAAGGTPDDILKIDFWAKDQAAGRAALNAEWEKMFPDPGARPARHTQALPADSRALIQCAFTAVIG